MAQTATKAPHVLEKNCRMYSLVRTAKLRGLHMRFSLQEQEPIATKVQRQLCMVLNSIFEPISPTSPTVALYFMQQAARAQHMRDVTTASGRNRRKIGTGLVSQDLIFLDMLGRYAQALGVNLTVETRESRPAHWQVSHARPRRSDSARILNYYECMREIARHGSRVSSSYLPKYVKFLASYVMPQVKDTLERMVAKGDTDGQKQLVGHLDRLLGETYHPKMFDLLQLGSLCRFTLRFSALPPDTQLDDFAHANQIEGQSAILVTLGELTTCSRELNLRIANHSRQGFLDWLAYYAEMLSQFGGKRMKQMTGIYNSQVRSYLQHPLNLRFDVVVRTAEAMGIALGVSRRH